jgi:hypothetical protein
LVIRPFSRPISAGIFGRFSAEPWRRRIVGITVAGVSEPHRASLTANLDAAGFFYDTTQA